MSRWLQMFCVFGALLLAGGCAHRAPPPGPPQPLLHDELFSPQPEVQPSASAVFEPSDAMRRYLAQSFNKGAVRRDARQALLDSLYGQGRLQLTYDAARTRTAAEAFDARAGNCLSLVIMTASFARQLGLQVSFRAAITEDLYSRSNGLVLANSHVYLVLDTLLPHGDRLGQVDDSLTVDFLPPTETRPHRSLPLTERTVVAMYFNNRAAEMLADDQVDAAYAWARAALLEDPSFATSANTLAVIYMRRGHWSAAEAALHFALAQDEDNTAALSNLQAVLGHQGRNAEAQQVSRRLLALQPVAPFHDYELGRQAMNAGNYRAASDWFARELRRQPFQPEVHFWAAQARWRLGDAGGAASHLRRAVETSLTNETRDLYGAKLEYLKALRAGSSIVQ